MVEAGRVDLRGQGGDNRGIYMGSSIECVFNSKCSQSGLLRMLY